MPTLERHRDMLLEDQFVDLLALGVVDDIMISQQGATEEQLKSLGKILNFYNIVQTKDTVELKIKLSEKVTDVEKDILFKNKGDTHKNRPDFNSYF